MNETTQNEKRKRGQGRIFQRGQQWWISYYGPDVETGRSKEFREAAGDQKAAEKLLTKRIREIGAHKIGAQQFQGPRQERVTVEELLSDLEADYEMNSRKSIPELKSHLKHIRDYFGLDRALAVTTDRITKYIISRQREGAAAATINRELAGLQTAFNLATKATPPKLLLVPNFPSLPENNARQGFFERGEFLAVMEKVKDQDVKDFCEWFYYTGMRPGETKALTFADLDRETWAVRLQGKDAKTGKPRTIPLVGPLRSVIERRIQARRLDCPFIFHRKGRKMGRFQRAWRCACEAAKLPNKLLYDFRRTAVRNMQRAGVPRRVAMMISGHKTEEVFERYNIVTDEDIEEAVTKTLAYVETLPIKTNVVAFNAQEQPAEEAERATV